MSKRPTTIFISAAEASGDQHAARLIEAIRRRIPDARFIGVAGRQMAEAGCEVLADMTRRASMLGGPLLQLRYYVKTIRRVQRQMREIAPDMHIPVDSPAMNWHLAAAARDSGAPVMYYIAPQVWAWAPWRARKLARLTDAVACILPFEQRYLRDRGVNATYVGHPLFETLPPRPEHPADLAEAWSEGTWRVAMLPGSRPGEIRQHAAALLATSRTVTRRWPKARCTFVTHSERCAESIRKAAGKHRPDVVVGRTKEMLAESHFAVAVSGTVTLEVAYFGVPMVILYRTSRLLRAMLRTVGRWGVPTPHFSLVNILAGRRIVPELMPWHGAAKPLVNLVMEMLHDIGYLHEARQELIDLIDPIRAEMTRPASDAAAELACKTLERR
ncbi:MAG: lipid-A-disaccharide synthase [Phycisphaerae bacterium]|nr:lipid-A-disaccharide synthase [Phycisphaerae bacterium]